MKLIVSFFIGFFVSLACQAQVYSEQISYDSFRVDPMGTCGLRKATQVLKDSKPIGDPQYHRYSFDPGSDLSVLDESEDSLYYKKLCEAAWTPKVVKKYKEYQSSFSKEDPVAGSESSGASKKK